MKKNIALTNVITSMLLQLATIAYGFLIPKIIISTFGSEVNGLVSSISQLLSYISLIEGGITAVVIARLYDPLVKHNKEEVQTVVNTSTNFFRKIGLIFIAYSVVLAFIAPLIYVKDDFDYGYIFTLTLILSIGLLIQYMTSLSLKCLLQADKKVFFVSITQIVILLSNMGLAVLSVKIYPEIHLLKLLTGITYIIQPILYGLYIKKHYELPKTKAEDKRLLADRWSGFANNLAYFIHTSTDITVLTFLTNLVTVSVYSVYSLVTAGLKSLLGAINTGVFASLGHLYAQGDYKKLEKKFNQYETIYLFLVFLCFTLASLLITPFVQIYVADANLDNAYTQPLFGYLLSLAVMLDLVKAPHVNLAYAANKFKDMTKPCFIEAGINIVVSVILVTRYGLIGVAIGTILAMLYRIIYQVDLTKKMMHQKHTNTYKTMALLLIPSIVSVLLCNTVLKIEMQQNTIFEWIKNAILYGLITAMIYAVFGLSFFRKNILTTAKKIRKTIRRRK